MLTVDGVGEWATASFGVGCGNELELLREIHWPDSLGLLYSAFTLAPYGEPRYVDLIYRELVVKDDGSIRLNQAYFDYLSGLTMTSEAFNAYSAVLLACRSRS